MGITIHTKASAKFTGHAAKLLTLFFIITLINSGCFLSNDIETYYGRTDASRAGEFRWSNGGLPQIFDPALAAAPPDTDAVRALYEGLTEYDPRSLAPVPGVALRWESSAENRVWTFFLRHNARWSNDDPVTAQDFVRSWQRAAALGDQAPHAKLLENIAGVRTRNSIASASPVELRSKPAIQSEQNSAPRQTSSKSAGSSAPKQPVAAQAFGAQALGDYVLRVQLSRPDANFPALVAHTIFRPVHDENEASHDATANKTEAQNLITNGAFHLSAISRDGIALERAKNYWDVSTVNLQKARLIAAPSVESALAAYRAGEVDAVTNAGFEPLVLKMLAPYKDFRRATYGALTFYSFNTSKQPFNDMRVRQALSYAIDRDRISEDEMGGATEPAKRFLPVALADKMEAGEASLPALEYDVVRARQLLAAAGYPNGNKFPRIRLLINRNDQQRLVAQAVAAMWQSALGITTEVIVKDWDGYEAALRGSDYDVARRGIVMQTSDQAVNLRAIFELEGKNLANSAAINCASRDEFNEEIMTTSFARAESQSHLKQLASGKAIGAASVSEAQCLEELPAMPLYFASSYALVKPYVAGFETNLLDTPLLKSVQIDTSWQQTPNSSARIVEEQP